MNATDAILDNLLDAVLVVDDAGTIIYANRAAQQLFARSGSELAGRPFGFTILPHEVQEIDVLKDGQALTVQMLASRIPWNGLDASLLSLRDVTAQKQAQEELDRQRRLLERTSEENAQYASLASHDLKEPVRKILFYSDRLLHGDRLPESEKTQVSRILAAAKRMQSLIGGIAELSRINHVVHTFSSVDLNRVVEEVCSDLELQIAEKRAKIEVGPLPVIEAIPDEMYQLFLNLIANSLKYAREDVPARVEVREQAAADADQVCIICSDNGIGFDNESGQKLFQPFQRLHTSEYEGMGIGLTLCQKIVNLHHGEISAEGRPGEGATFRVCLPRHQPKRP